MVELECKSWGVDEELEFVYGLGRGMKELELRMILEFLF